MTNEYLHWQAAGTSLPQSAALWEDSLFIFFPPEMNRLKINNLKIELLRDLKNGSVAGLCHCISGGFRTSVKRQQLHRFQIYSAFPTRADSSSSHKENKKFGNAKELVSFGSPTKMMGPLEYYLLHTFIA